MFLFLDAAVPRECNEIDQCNRVKNGVYDIAPYGDDRILPVYCYRINGGNLAYTVRQE